MTLDNSHRLVDIAVMLNCTESQLLEVINKNGLPLYVIPNNWYAHRWTYRRDVNDEISIVIEQKEDNEIYKVIYDEIEFDHKTFKLSSDILKPERPVDPLPLSIRNIKMLFIKGVIEEDIFFAKNADCADDSIVAYFKLCNPKDYKQNFQASISFEDVVVRNDSFEKLKKIVSETPLTKPPSDNQLDKMYRMIGILTLLLSKKAPKYFNDPKPNYTNISIDLLKELDELEKEIKLDRVGLADTNLRQKMSDGVKCLYGKKI